MPKLLGQSSIDIYVVYFDFPPKMPKLLGQSDEQMEMTCRLASTGRKGLVYISMNRWKRAKMHSGGRSRFTGCQIAGTFRWKM